MDRRSGCLGCPHTHLFGRGDLAVTLGEHSATHLDAPEGDTLTNWRGASSPLVSRLQVPGELSFLATRSASDKALAAASRTNAATVAARPARILGQSARERREGRGRREGDRVGC